MNLEDHILWKIVATYDLLYRTRKKFASGDIVWEEYAAIMEPECTGVMTELLNYIEQGDFLDYHRRNVQLPEGKGYPGRDNLGYPFPSTSEWVLEQYGKFVETFRNALMQTNPEIKTRDLIIGFDSFVGWMHGSFEISRWVIKQCPFTGDWNEDYRIALDAMTICSGFSYATGAIEYLRACARENKRVKVDWKLVRSESKGGKNGSR